MASQSRVFHALNGEEVKRAILHDIEAAFAEVSDFRPAIALPVVRWEWTCKLSVYPRDPQDITMKKAGDLTAGDASEAEKQNATDTVLEGFGAAGADGMEAPDQVRERIGLPVPTLKSDRRTGNSFDEMVTKAPEPEEGWTPPGTRGTVLDKGGPRLKTK
jgi:hypothetical protein